MHRGCCETVTWSGWEKDDHVSAWLIGKVDGVILYEHQIGVCHKSTGSYSVHWESGEIMHSHLGGC